eukprot:1960354-Pleurochrysis_carterae.AAC.2
MARPQCPDNKPTRKAASQAKVSKRTCQNENQKADILMSKGSLAASKCIEVVNERGQSAKAAKAFTGSPHLLHESDKSTGRVATVRLENPVHAERDCIAWTTCIKYPAACANEWYLLLIVAVGPRPRLRMLEGGGAVSAHPPLRTRRHQPPQLLLACRRASIPT